MANSLDIALKTEGECLWKKKSKAKIYSANGPKNRSLTTLNNWKDPHFKVLSFYNIKNANYDLFKM